MVGEQREVDEGADDEAAEVADMRGEVGGEGAEGADEVAVEVVVGAGGVEGGGGERRRRALARAQWTACS